jgi:PAS domain S-box-containing protein
MLWMSNPDNLYTYFNRSWLEFTGRSLEAETGSGWTAGVHPDDLKRCLPVTEKAFAARQPFTVEYRLLPEGGHYRWIRHAGVPRFLSTGAFAGYIGSAVDFTSHKIAEEALASMSHRMFEAHETERNRIARELHDDIGQRMAVLTIELDLLSGDRPVAASEMRAKIRAIADQAHELAQDIQAISHSLHSSKLDYLGLVSASAGFCREVFDQQGLEVRFTSHGIPDHLPKDVALCLYRVLQEAVNNAMKHAGAGHVAAALRGDAAEIHLEVVDDGTGFDPEARLDDWGLGLISMKERLGLIGGEMTIQSRPGAGTTVRAWVPVQPPGAPSDEAQD